MSRYIVCVMVGIWNAGSIIMVDDDEEEDDDDVGVI